MSEITLKSKMTHSEQVRARRNQTSQARQVKATQQVRQPVRSVPPVVSRRGVSPHGTPTIQRAKSRTRRSFSLSMENGAELVLPSLPNIQIGWKTVSGGMAALLLVLILFFTNASVFRVSTPELIGITRVSAADMASVAGLGNTPIYTVDPAVIKAQVAQSYPFLTNIKVSVGLPANVIITAQERKPILAWEYNGPIVWVDAEGFIFESNGDVSGLPTVHADNLPPYTEINQTDQKDSLVAASPLAPTVRKMDPTLLRAALQLAAFVPSGSDLAYSPTEGYGWYDPGGWKVFIGTDTSNLDVKLLVYQAINQALKERGITPSMISVAQPDAPFYRVE